MLRPWRPNDRSMWRVMVGSGNFPLFSDTETAENFPQQIIGAEFSRYDGQGILCQPQLFSKEFQPIARLTGLFDMLGCLGQGN